MTIEYKIKFEQDSVTITQTVDTVQVTVVPKKGGGGEDPPGTGGGGEDPPGTGGGPPAGSGRVIGVVLGPLVIGCSGVGASGPKRGGGGEDKPGTGGGGEDKPGAGGGRKPRSRRKPKA